MDAVRGEQSQDLLVRTAAVVAAQREFASRLRTRTIRDPLTGLPVRSLLVDRLELSLAAAGHGTGRLAVLSCDLDGLSALEHRYGPTVADAARSEASARLVAAVRRGDLVARVGTQAFVLLCPGIAVPEDVEGIVERAATSFDAPVRPTPDVLAPLRIGVGAALSGRDSTPASLLTAAHRALTRVRADRLRAGRTA